MLLGVGIAAALLWALLSPPADYVCYLSASPALGVNPEWACYAVLAAGGAVGFVEMLILLLCVAETKWVIVWDSICLILAVLLSTVSVLGYASSIGLSTTQYTVDLAVMVRVPDSLRSAVPHAP